MAPLVILETDRLRLRQFVEADAPLVLALDSDPEVMRYVGPYGLPDEAAYRGRIRAWQTTYYDRSPAFGFWATEVKATGEFIGWFHLRAGADYRFAAESGFEPGDYDLGYRLVRRAWGQGYATEAARAVLVRAFTEPTVLAVVAVALVGNVASTRVMEKIGMERVYEFPIPGYEEPAVKYRAAKPRAA